MNPFQHAASARHFARKVAQGSHLIASRFAVRQGPSPEPSAAPPNFLPDVRRFCRGLPTHRQHAGERLFIAPGQRGAAFSRPLALRPPAAKTCTHREKSFRVAALRMPSFSKSTRRGQKSSICEELVIGNLTSRNLTWANAGIRRGRRPYRPSRLTYRRFLSTKVIFCERRRRGERMSTPLPRALRRTTRTPSRNREGERQGGEPSRWDGSIDPCRKVARSGRAARPPPTNRQRHEQPFTIGINTSSSSSQGTFFKEGSARDLCVSFSISPSIQKSNAPHLEMVALSAAFAFAFTRCSSIGAISVSSFAEARSSRSIGEGTPSSRVQRAAKAHESHRDTS